MPEIYGQYPTLRFSISLTFGCQTLVRLPNLYPVFEQTSPYNNYEMLTACNIIMMLFMTKASKPPLVDEKHRRNLGI